MIGFIEKINFKVQSNKYIDGKIKNDNKNK